MQIAQWIFDGIMLIHMLNANMRLRRNRRELDTLIPRARYATFLTIAKGK